MPIPVISMDFDGDFINRGSWSAQPTVTGALTGTGGAVGRGGTFDAIDDYLDFGTGLTQPNTWTMAMFIKPTAIDSTIRFLTGSEQTGVANVNKWAFSVNDGGAGTIGMFQCRSGAQGYAYANAWNTTYFPAGQWVHVAAVVNVTDYRLFIGGSRVATTINNMLDLSGTSEKFYFSKRPTDGGGLWYGGVDKIRVYLSGVSDANIWRLSQGFEAI